MSSPYGNRQKHLNPNPIQRWLLQRFHRRVIELVQHTGAGCILDAGCGEGFLMCDLEKAGLTAALAGAELNRETLAWGRTNCSAMSPLHVADVCRLPFRNHSFDLVLCLEVLEHLPDPSDGLRELLRVSGKHVLISVPHEPWFRGANFLRGKHIRDWGNDPEHLHTYDGQAFRRLVASRANLIWYGTSFPWQMALLQVSGLP